MKFIKNILYAFFLVVIMAFATPVQVYTYEFGIKLFPAGGSLITTAVLTISDKKIVRTEVIPENVFLLEMSGSIFSKANPAPVDLFYSNGIYSCSRDKDTIRYKYRQSDTARWRNSKQQGNYKSDYVVKELKVECPILKELWRVRYKYDIRLKNYNFSQNIKAGGWSNDRFWPTLAQVNYLKATYGSDGINDFIYGDKLYKFLRDVQDTTWINNYKSLK